jgi:7-cyano-7-deazaguanine synthase in queuosine biosynthesis
MYTRFIDEFVNIKDEMERLFLMLTNRPIQLIIKSKPSKGSQTILNNIEPRDPILFSGGVDSLSGAIKCISENSRNVLVHVNSNKQIFGNVRRILTHEFFNKTQTFCINVRIKSIKHRSFFSNTRGLLYLTVGYDVSRHIKSSKLIFCENGAQMLDIMLGSTAYGNAIATKNTNLKYLRLIEEILSKFEGDRFIIDYPFRNNTKSESIAAYLNSDLIQKSWSCYSTRGMGEMCGSCWNCFITKMSALAGGFPSNVLKFKTDPLANFLSSPLYLDNQRILYNLMTHYEKVINRNPTKIEELTKYGSLFQDPTELATRFGLELFLGISISLAGLKTKNGLGKKAEELLTKIDPSLLENRKERLASFKSSF